MKWILLIILTSIDPNYPDLREERDMPNEAKCQLEKRKQELSAEASGASPYEQTVECKQVPK